MRKTNCYMLLTALLLCKYNLAQQLKPGFDKAQYIEMLKIAQRQAVDTAK